MLTADSFLWLKVIHVSCALLSVSGFALRGYWMFSGNELLKHRAARVAPHFIDSLLLASAIGMLVIWRVSPLDVGWLSAKMVALLVYIGLGMVALRFGRTRRTRVLAWLLALVAASYIVAVAYTKDPMGFLFL